MFNRKKKLVKVYLTLLCCMPIYGLAAKTINQFPIDDSITVVSLLREMVAIDNDAIYPDPNYSSKLQTSHDRRSLVPGSKWWHANNDDSGFIRYEVNNGRAEKVLFDQQGPGVVTRIVTTGKAKGATLRIYFDNEREASITIPFYDIARFPLVVPSGLLYRHEHYSTTQGSSFYFPLPYEKRCKITVDDLDRGYYFHANYRSYPKETAVKTFSLADSALIHPIADSVSQCLQNPKDFLGKAVAFKERLKPSCTLSLELPSGSWAIRTLHFRVSINNNNSFAQLMRGLIVKLYFDDKQTAWVPLSDFSGGGIGAPPVKSFYLSSDGKGAISVRFIMPYKKNGRVELQNITGLNANAEITAHLEPRPWVPGSLYFHASWRQERGLETNKGLDFNNATIVGRGVFKGDVLSVYNHMQRWWGEGDEHIWIDHENFPSHFGCGTEDYYNTTFAPIHPYFLPFGGAPREDDEASRGYNNFVRTRNLDGIPFSKRLKFDFELISWDGGQVDYASTVFWYGDADSYAVNPSGSSEALEPLPPAIHTGDPIKQLNK